MDKHIHSPNCNHDHGHDENPFDNNALDDNIASVKELVYSRQVIEMITVANEFCLFLEKCEALNKNQVLEYLLRIAPLLYLKGSLLPDVQLSDPEATERFVNEIQWETIFNSLKKILENSDTFYFTDSNLDTIEASIAEHLADIYQDLKDFVWLYQKDTLNPKQNAVFECKALFQTNWGIKITETMKAIHLVLFNEQILTSNSSNESWEND